MVYIDVGVLPVLVEMYRAVKLLGHEVLALAAHE